MRKDIDIKKGEMREREKEGERYRETDRKKGDAVLNN